jgi:hypothetical protein
LPEGAEIAMGQTKARIEQTTQLPQRAPTPIWDRPGLPHEAMGQPTIPQPLSTPGAFQPVAGPALNLSNLQPPPSQQAPGGLPGAEKRIGMKTRVDLAADEAVIYQLSIVAKETPEHPVTIAARAKVHGDVLETNEFDNLATDTDPVGIYADGFDAAP